MTTTRFKALTLAATLALGLATSLTGAMAQSAGGGDGGGGSIGYDAPTVTHAVPGSTAPRQGQVNEQHSLCGFELLRGHYCERRARR